MAIGSDDYIGNSVFVYNDDGENLICTTVVDFDKTELRLVLKEWPIELNAGDKCRLLIMTGSAPFEYHGRIRYDFGSKFIALFRGKEKESRGATRYKLNAKAKIEELIYEGEKHGLYQPVDILILNISTSGMRFRAPHNTINVGDRFKTTVNFDNKAKALFAQVVNEHEVDEKNMDYGCRFLLAVGKLL